MMFMNWVGVKLSRHITSVGAAPVASIRMAIFARRATIAPDVRLCRSAILAIFTPAFSSAVNSRSSHMVQIVPAFDVIVYSIFAAKK